MKKRMKAVLWFLCVAAAVGGCQKKEEPDETIKWGIVGGVEQILEETTAVEPETSTPAEAPADVTPEETTVPETTVPEMTTAEEAEPSLGPSISFDVDLGALANLSGEAKSWGPGVNMDEQNRPTGATMYQEKYGQYDADFIRGGDKKIYLTLDEGYENGYTSVILDTLKEKQVSAVFFITMSYAENEPELVRRMIDEGHVVGAHSVTHPAEGLPSLTLEEQLAELRDLHEYVRREFGYEMYLFRYPAGIFSEQSLALVQATGYRSVFWSYAYRDWVTDDQPDPEEAMGKAMARLHPGAIYLLHAVSSTNAEIMGDFIDQARAAGYEFVEYVPE